MSSIEWRQTNKIVRDLSAFVVVMGCIFGVVFLIGYLVSSRDPDHEVSNATYTGTLKTEANTYHVVIDEVDRGNGVERIIHLQPEGSLSYVSITGHDYPKGFDWDRIFYCGDRKTTDGLETGCNAVYCIRNGDQTKWIFEPCPADEGKVTPFTDTEIKFAIQELNLGMNAVYNTEHLQTRYEWDPVKKDNVKTFDRDELPNESGKGIQIPTVGPNSG